MPRSVAPDERAVEVVAGADYGVAATGTLATYDRTENREHLALRALATDPREIELLDELIRGDRLEARRIARTQSLFALLAQHGRRLAGFFTAATRG